MKKNQSAKRIALGAIVAGAAGYVAGVMTAPKSGRATRKELSKTAENSMQDVEQQIKDMQSELGKIIDIAKDQGGDMGDKAQAELKSLMNIAKDSKDKVQQVIGAVHSGNASDKDLKKAMSDAKRAIDHIKDFIKK